MWGQIDGKTKMEIASEVLTNSINKLPEEKGMGLFVYGHRQKKDCEDVEQLSSIKNTNKSSVVAALNSIKPLGRIPLAYSALQAIDLLRKNKEKATIILITDGIESCGGNICDVIKAAREEGIEFRLHIIGFGLQGEETDQLRCAAQAGDGQYYDAQNAEGLGEVLDEATHQEVEKPEDNMKIYAIKNGEAIDAHIKVYPVDSKSYIISSRTYKDTAFFHVPSGIYNLEIKPLANSNVNAITIPNVEHDDTKITLRDVSFDSGKLSAKVLNNGIPWDAVIHIYNSATDKYLAGGRTYADTDDYDLNPGMYDVVFKAMKLRGLEIEYKMEDVLVEAQKLTEVEHNFESGTAMIGAKSNNELIDVVINIIEQATRRSCGGGRTYSSASSNPKKTLLTPGIYEVTVKGLREHQGKQEKFTMTIEADKIFEKMVVF